MIEARLLPRRPQAVVFDMDGLLLDTETMYRAAHVLAASEGGFTMTDALHASLVGRPRDAVERLLAAEFGPSIDMAWYNSRCDHHFENLAATAIPLRTGVIELLELLEELRIPRAVATSTDRKRAEHHLGKAGIIARFDTLVTRTDVTDGKPAPETFLKAAAELGVDPALCLALEDSHNGVRAAASAGMMTVMIPNLLPATPEMYRLCALVRTSLLGVRGDIMRSFRDHEDA